MTHFEKAFYRLPPCFTAPECLSLGEAGALVCVPSTNKPEQIHTGSTIRVLTGNFNRLLKLRDGLVTCRF